MEAATRTVVHPNKEHISYKLERIGLYTKLTKLATKKKVLKNELTWHRQLAMYVFYVRLCWGIGRRRLLFQLAATSINAYLRSASTSVEVLFNNTAHKTVDTKIFRMQRLANLAALNFAIHIISSYISDSIQSNEGIFTYRFNDQIRSRLLMARQHLDISTDDSGQLKKKLSEAEDMLNGNGASLLTATIHLFSTVLDLAFSIKQLLRNVDRDLLPIASVAFASSSFTLIGWLFQNFDWGSIDIKVTNKDYTRMLNMFKLSKQTDAPDLETLNLHTWISEQYSKAKSHLGGNMTAAAPEWWDYQGKWTNWSAKRLYANTIIQMFFAYTISTGHTKSLLAEGAAQAITNLDTTINLGHDVAWKAYTIVDYFRDLKNSIKPVNALAFVLDLYEDAKKLAIDDELLMYTPRQLQGNRIGMKIEFRDVYFRYPKSTSKRWSLCKLSFTVHPGEKCVLVGENGSGKSTCIGLILGLHKPTRGTILINDIPINKFSRRELYQAISVLFQSTTTLTCSIREFIAIGDIDAYRQDDQMTDRITEALIKSGAKAAVDNLKLGLDSQMDSSYSRWNTEKGCTEQKMLFERFQEDDKDDDERSEPEVDENELMSEDEVDEKPQPAPNSTGSSSLSLQEDNDKATVEVAKEDLETAAADFVAQLETATSTGIVDEASKERKKIKIIDEEHPTNFSGGENAKIVMARNFLRSTDLALFDEPFAALDPLSEKQAFDAMLKHGSHQTMILITHRLYMAKRADRVLVMAKGKLAESGSPADLLATNGKFKEMYDAQKNDDEEARVSKEAEVHAVANGTTIDEAGGTA